jgi:predicted RNA-binding protein associated with RNAse of E/G family
MWSNGDQIIYREITHGKVWTVRPVTVIEDNYALTALYFRKYTSWKICTPESDGIDLLVCKANLNDWTLEDTIWTLGDTIFLIYPNDAHATHVMWDKERRFIGWYINLQEPIRRTSIGFDFLDQELDIVVKPDLSWFWKDSEHLAQAQAIGLFSSEQVKEIRREAQRVIEKIRCKAEPFDRSWSDWQAPVDWKNPGLPEGWDKVGL